MKNKIVNIILATAMVATLAGCGQKITPAENTTETAVEESATTESSDEAAEDASDAEATDADATAETEDATAEATTEDSDSTAEDAEETDAEAEDTESSEDAEAEDAGDAEFSTGVIKGSEYSNDYFGVKFTVPSDYSFLDEDTLAQLNGMTSDLFSDNKAAQKAIENGTSAIVAYAVQGSTNDNINVSIQSNASLANALLDEKSVMEVTLDQVKEVLEAQGAEFTTAEVIEKEIGGEKHWVTNLVGTISGKELHQQEVCFQKGDYMLAIAASSFDSDYAETLMSSIER